MAKYSVTGVESGASDIGSIINVDGDYLYPFGNTPNDILQRHRAALDGVDLFPSSRIMEAGNRFEGVIRDWFEDDFHIKVGVPSSGYRAKECNMVASLDGIIKGGAVIADTPGVEHTLEGLGVIDFKMPTYTPDDALPLHYQCQLQAQMLCAGAGWGILASLARVNCEWTIALAFAHAGMQKAIIEAVDRFWDHMKNDTDYPAATTTEANKIVAGNRRPDVHDLTEAGDDTLDNNDRDQLINLAEAYQAAKTSEKNAKAQKEGPQLEINKVMGGVEKLELPDFKINWATIETKAKPETTKIVPATEAKTSRRFTLTEKKT